MEVSLNQGVTQSTGSASYIDRLNEKRDKEEEKLASGKRINGAADDAAGLQITERLTSQINNDVQLANNNQDQLNINNVQDGQLSAIQEGLARANTLSVQSGTPLADQSAIQAEFNQIAEQVNTVAGEALGDANFLSGLNAADPQATQAALENAYNQLAETSSSLGAQNNSLSSQVSTYQTAVVNVSSSRSNIQDSDYSQTSTQQQQAGVQLQASVINAKDEEARKGLLVNQLV
ncbi:flagellin [Thalassotalea agariperforans]